MENDNAIIAERDLLLARIQRKVHDFTLVKMSSDTFYYNLLLTIIYGIDKNIKLMQYIDTFIFLLSEEQVNAFNAWYIKELLPTDYFYDVGAFLPNMRDEAAFQKRQRDLRPLFIQLHEAIKRRLANKKD